MKDFAKDRLRLAVVQDCPVFFDKSETVKQVVRKIEEAASEGAEFIVFPESYIPGYPYGLTFGFTVGARTEDGRKDWKLYYDNSVLVPSEETRFIGEAAKESGVYVSVGITERDSVNASLYCTQLLFGPDGEILSKHRKIKPTGAERFIWADGQEGFFPAPDTPWGKVGTLICWENYMILARAALYQKGISIYLAPNTNDNPEWLSTMVHIAVESHCFVVNAGMLLYRDRYPSALRCRDEIERLSDIPIRGGSCIIDPYGHTITGPVFDRPEILYADLNLQMVPESRMEFDGIGHYSRPDLLHLDAKEG